MIFTQYWDVRKFLSFSERRHRSNPVWIPNVSNHTCSPPMVLWDVVWEEKNAHKQHLGSEDPQIRRSILSAVTIEMALLGGITPTPGALKKCPFHQPFSEPASASPAWEFQSSTMEAEWRQALWAMRLTPYHPKKRLPASFPPRNESVNQTENDKVFIVSLCVHDLGQILRPFTKNIILLFRVQYPAGSRSQIVWSV